MTVRGLGMAFLLLIALDAPSAAQRLTRPAVTSGVQGLTYRFGENFGVRSLSQFAVPIAAAMPHGAFVFDVGTYLATTRFERRDRSTLSVTGLTDTQLRAAYTLGQDAVVLTAVANLPTGASRLTTSEYSVLAAASSSFLAFPVNAYGSGASLTGGAAVAFSRGEWNLGLGASLRVSDEFTPFVESDGGFTYRAGLETRVRAGADRLLGDARLAFGLTMSTFRDDEFAAGSGATGIYRPGTRWIGEVSYATLVGGTTVVGYLWDFLRLAGDSAGTGTGNRENVLAAGVMASTAFSPRFTWEPRVETRLSSPEEGSGFLVEFASALRIRISSRTSVVPALRLDLGRLVEPPPGIGHPIRGFGFSVFVRESF